MKLKTAHSHFEINISNLNKTPSYGATTGTGENPGWFPSLGTKSLRTVSMK